MEIPSPAELARELAERARQLRSAVHEELARERDLPEHAWRPVRELYENIDMALVRQTEAEFADAYAQTLTYGLLAARWMARRADTPFTAATIGQLLPSTSGFLAELFHKLVELRHAPRLSRLIEELVSLLRRTAVQEVFAGSARDPVIHFYEEFLDAYDPSIRAARGVYYTPDEVVQHMVHTTHELLKQEFGLSLGLADITTWGELASAHGIAVPAGIAPEEPFVQILDPATGTGTFLMHVIEIIHDTMMRAWAGADWAENRNAAIETHATAWISYVHRNLLPRISGFELMMAPYMVCHLRLGLLLQETGFVFGPGDRLRVFLTNTLHNTLDDSSGSRRELLLGTHIAAEALEADQVKNTAPISVIIGNPPYEREPSDSMADGTHRGGWIRDGWSGWNHGRAPLEDYLQPARDAGAGRHLKNIYNLYIYFWRWATWRVFDRYRAPGIVSFITASSYARGPGFIGLRAHWRGCASTIHILDLEGDQRGTRITENVFRITTPVCIATLSRPPAARRESAVARYYRMTGTRADKLACCARWQRLQDIPWIEVAPRPEGPLVAGGRSSYPGWPEIRDIFPWQCSGAQFKRTWPIEHTEDALHMRWHELMRHPDPADRATLFRESRDRSISRTYPSLQPGQPRQPAIASLGPGAQAPPICRYAFRSFDRQWCFADTRLGDHIRPPLWLAYGPKQVYLTSLLSGILGHGPAATVCAQVPDLHHFRGSYGGKDVIPLWRDADATTPNVSPGVLEALYRAFGVMPEPVDLFAYAYAVLANPGYVRRFADELHVPGPRLPITRDPALFALGAQLGRELICLHTYGERLREPVGGRLREPAGERLRELASERWFAEAEAQDGFELAGTARIIEPIPSGPGTYPERYHYAAATEMLAIGPGRIGPVAPEIWELSVSGLPIVKSWLDYRMKKRAGKKSSPLDAIRPASWTDQMTRELLELLWVLEATLARYPVLDAFLGQVLAGSVVTGAELPARGI